VNILYDEISVKVNFSTFPHSSNFKYNPQFFFAFQQFFEKAWIAISIRKASFVCFKTIVINIWVVMLQTLFSQICGGQCFHQRSYTGNLACLLASSGN